MHGASCREVRQLYRGGYWPSPSDAVTRQGTSFRVRQRVNGSGLMEDREQSRRSQWHPGRAAGQRPGPIEVQCAVWPCYGGIRVMWRVNPVPREMSMAWGAGGKRAGRG
jgi:hypothetical protein